MLRYILGIIFSVGILYMCLKGTRNLMLAVELGKKDKDYEEVLQISMKCFTVLEIIAVGFLLYRLLEDSRFHINAILLSILYVVIFYLCWRKSLKFHRKWVEKNIEKYKMHMREFHQ